MRSWLWVAIGAALAVWAIDYITGANQVSDALASVLGPDGESANNTTSAPSSSTISGSILGALSSFENVASQHNNPGGICGSFDSAGNCLGPATYSTLEEGIAAANAKIARWIAANPGITVYDFVKKWSGGTGEVLDNYVTHVAQALGLEPDDPIANAMGDELSADDGSEDDGQDVAYA